MLDKILTALSTEASIVAFFSTFFGAIAAFLFAMYLNWRSDRHRDLIAGNEAIFALSQMYTHATNINNQLFLDQRERIRQLLGREALFFEFMPIEIAAEQVPRVQLDKLLFLLRSHAPDLLNRLAGVDREFGVIMKFIEQRNEAQKEFQRRTSDAYVGSQIVTAGDLRTLAGPELCIRLEKITDNLRESLPRCTNDLMDLTRQVTNVLKFEFPFNIVAGFDPIERDEGFQALKHERPRTWRRCVRWISQFARKPIRLTRDKRVGH